MFDRRPRRDGSCCPGDQPSRRRRRKRRVRLRDFRSRRGLVRLRRSSRRSGGSLISRSLMRRKRRRLCMSRVCQGMKGGLWVVVHDGVCLRLSLMPGLLRRKRIFLETKMAEQELLCASILRSLLIQRWGGKPRGAKCPSPPRRCLGLRMRGMQKKLHSDTTMTMPTRILKTEHR